MTTSYVKKPSECTPKELSDFEALVRKADEVDPIGLTERVAHSSNLLFLFDSAKALCGVSALKHPSEGYRSGVFRKAKTSLSPSDFPVELGWVVVSPSHRGQLLSRPLVGEIIPHAAGSLMYATTRAENEKMHRTLIRYGFRQEGAAYRSSRGPYDLVLFVQHKA